MEGLSFDQIDWSNPEAAFDAMGIGQPGGLRMPQIISARACRDQAQTRSVSIYQNYELLNAIVVRHEATLQNRWKKKTKEARRKIVQIAWGAPMSKTHRPDLQDITTGPLPQAHQHTRNNREAFLWPDFNEEDLIKPRTLLLLFEARGRHLPATFAHTDRASCHIGLVSQVLMPAFLNEHVIMFRHTNDARKYAELLNWDDHPDAFDWLNNQIGAHPGEGLLILEIQERILSFLVSCAKQILQNIPEQELLTTSIQPAPPTASENGNGFSTLSIMAGEAPYRVPANIDFGRITSLLGAKRDEAEDHLWSLREDPGYYADCMRDYREHRQEMLKDTRGQKHAVFRKDREDILWGRVVSNVLLKAYLYVDVWTELHNRALDLKQMQADNADRIKPEKDLPQAYLIKLLHFVHHLKQACNGPCNELKTSFVASPPARQYFERAPEDDPLVTKISTQSKSGARMDKPEADITRLFTFLWEGGQNLHLIGLTGVVDEVSRLVDKEPKAQAFLSSYISNIVSELSILSECLRQVYMYQPWASKFEQDIEDNKSELESEYGRTTSPWKNIPASFHDNDVLARYGTVSQRTFYYPVEKRRTSESVEAIRSAEANLDLFWSKVDELTRNKGRGIPGTAARRLLMSRTLQRTPEWVESGKNTKVGTVKASNGADAIIKPLSELYFELEHRSEKAGESSSSQQAPPKVKEKTRGIARPAAEDNAERLLVDVAGEPRAEKRRDIIVDARALKVFKTLFYTPSTTGTPGEVPWTQFLHAMTFVGFHAEKLQGSAWQFIPVDTAMGIERAIQFHEPHPSPKIPFWVARNFGRRLNRAFGWVGSMFKLAEEQK